MGWAARVNPKAQAVASGEIPRKRDKRISVTRTFIWPALGPKKRKWTKRRPREVHAAA